MTLLEGLNRQFPFGVGGSSTKHGVEGFVEAYSNEVRGYEAKGENPHASVLQANAKAYKREAEGKPV